MRLGEVADVRIAPNPAVIRREGVSRYVDVAERRRALSGLRDARRRGALATSTSPSSSTRSTGLDRQPVGRLIAIGVAAAIGILLLLQAAFGSWRVAALTFSTLPVAVAGGVLAAVAAGGTLSFGSVIGLLAVFGLAARNAVLLIDHYQHLEQDEGEAFGTELVLRGAHERVSGTLATAVAGALVLLPFVIAGPIPGYEIVQPLAVVVLGGLVTSTLLTLFVMPALYLRLASSPEREKPVTAPAVPQPGS